MRIVLPLLTAACTTTLQAPSLLLDEPEVVLDRAVLASDATSCAPLADGSWVVSGPEAIQIRDPRAPSPEILQVPGERVQGASRQGEALLVLTDAALTWWDGRAWPSPLEADLGALPTAWRVAEDGAWWMRVDGAWTRISEDTRQIPAIDGAPVTGPIAPAGSIAGTPVDVVATDTEVAILGGGGPAHPGIALESVRSVAIDASGATWAADGVRLWRYGPAEGWTSWILPEGVSRVEAHPRRPEVWVRGSTRAWLGAADGLVEIADPPLEAWQRVDSFGRLVTQEADGCVAYGRERLVTWLDVPLDPIESAHPVTLDPSGVDQVSAVEVTLDGAPVDPGSAPPWRFWLDPAIHAEGPHSLAATVTWADGVRATATVEVAVAPVDVTWGDDVFPLFQARCAACHGGASETVLEEPDAWIPRWARILELVTTQQMPLGLEPLTAAEIELLEAWADAGFPE